VPRISSIPVGGGAVGAAVRAAASDAARTNFGNKVME